MAFLRGALCVSALFVVQISLIAGRQHEHEHEHEKPVATIAGPDNNNRVYPPNTLRYLTDDQIAHHPKRHGRNAQQRAAFVAPASFNAATDPKWNRCPSIRTIRNQGACGDCWAVSSASVIADRLCIVRNVTDFISGSYVAGCAYPGQSANNNCNLGGNPAQAFNLAAMYGVTSGGEYGSNVGCNPYTVNGSIAIPLTCPTSCTNALGYGTAFSADITNHQIDSYWINYNNNVTTANQQPNIDANVAQMQEDIYNNGPIVASIGVYPTFQNWNFTANGPYTGPSASDLATYPSPPGSSPSPPPGHAVRIVGWDVTTGGMKYWIIANSWGTWAGVNGYYYVKMGSNVIGIEQNYGAPIVSVAGTVCNKATFCSAPVDQAATLDFTSPSTSKQYLFQGSCLLRVQTIAGKLSSVGAATPIAGTFLNTYTPITNQMVWNNTLSLLNSAGIGGKYCASASGSAKISCSSGSWSFTGNRGFVVLPTGDYYATMPAYPTKIAQSVQSSLSYSYRDWNLALANFTVTAFLSRDATSAYVFAKDGSGNPLTGIMGYPSPVTPAGAPFTWITPLAAATSANAVVC